MTEPAAAVQAFDDILGMFKAAFDSGASDLVVVYPGKDYADLFNGDESWARVSLGHQLRDASSISGAAGQRRYTSEGFLSVQIFVPRNGDDSLTDAQDLGKIFTDAYEGKISENGVEFFAVTAQESTAIDRWEVVNCSLRFRYSEVR